MDEVDWKTDFHALYLYINEVFAPSEEHKVEMWWYILHLPWWFLPWGMKRKASQVIGQMHESGVSSGGSWSIWMSYAEGSITMLSISITMKNFAPSEGHKIGMWWYTHHLPWWVHCWQCTRYLTTAKAKQLAWFVPYPQYSMFISSTIGTQCSVYQMQNPLHLLAQAFPTALAKHQI